MASGDDGETTLVELRSLVETFVKDRQWEGFHTPENLSQAISVEAAELLECFLWLSRKEADSRIKDPAGRAAVVDELADVIIYALSLANALQVDVSTAVRDKLDLNERRFPVAAWRGRTAGQLASNLCKLRNSRRVHASTDSAREQGFCHRRR